jgi:group I intron endonuclease
MVIYKITNKINNKAYIGQTTGIPSKRWKEHCRKGFLLTKAIKKYGEENFTYEVICNCSSIEELNIKEVEHIDLEKSISPNGYNLNSGGLNHRMHQSTKDKVSKVHKGKRLSIGTIEKLQVCNLGKKLSQEVKNKIRFKQTGMKRTEEACNNIALSLRKDKRRIFCHNNKTFYLSSSEAGKHLNLDRHSINKALSGKRNHHKGYVFKYEDISG